MKVATRVATGAGLVVALLFVALAANVVLVRHLTAAEKRLTTRQFEAVTKTLDLLRALEQSEQALQKLAVTHDEGYARQVDRLADAIDGRLAEIRPLAADDEEVREVHKLDERWSAFRRDFEQRRPELVDHARGVGAVGAPVVPRPTDVRVQAVALVQVLRRSIENEVRRADAEAATGEKRALAFAIVALVVSALFVLRTVRSLNAPLGRLIAATRAVGAGAFDKLAPRGNDELAELARAFDRMVEQLAEVDGMKREFLSRVSHELKTPLSAMQETTQLLLDELAGPLTPKQKRLLKLNHDAGRRLSAMLSRLLDVARLEAGAVTYDVRPTELAEVLRTARQEIDARLTERGLDVSLTLPARPLVIHADRDWLLQVFANLLDNAVKYSPPKTKLALGLVPAEAAMLAGDVPPRVRALVATGPCALVTVADEGPGIPADARERVFERFFQVERRRRAGDGVGLGLAICRDVVAAHGGALWVSAREGGGSVFSVALPLAVEDNARRANDEGELGARR